MTLLMKLGWELITRTDKLWVEVIREKYRGGVHPIPVVSKRQVESNSWRGIRKVWHHVCANLKFWTDIWIGDEPLINYVNNTIPDEELSKTVRDYVADVYDWNWVLLNNLLSTRACMMLVNLL